MPADLGIDISLLRPRLLRATEQRATLRWAVHDGARLADALSGLSKGGEFRDQTRALFG